MPSKFGRLHTKHAGNNIRKRNLKAAQPAFLAAKRAQLIVDENVNPNILLTPSQTPSAPTPTCRCSEHFVTPTISSPKGVCLSCGNNNILHSTSLDVPGHDLIGNVSFHRDIHKDQYYTDIFQLPRDEMIHEIVCYFVKDDLKNNKCPSQESVQLRLGKLSSLTLTY